jgi:hypothetical protein
MAPVARRVTYAQKDGLVLFFCALQSFFPPRVPVDGIMRMLQKVRAGLFCKAVWFIVVNVILHEAISARRYLDYMQKRGSIIFNKASRNHMIC